MDEQSGPVESFRNGGVFDDSGIRLEWERILAVNYWPIFWSAKEMLGLMPTATASGVLVLQRRVMRKHAQVFFFSYGPFIMETRTRSLPASKSAHELPCRITRRCSISPNPPKDGVGSAS